MNTVTDHTMDGTATRRTLPETGDIITLDISTRHDGPGRVTGKVTEIAIIPVGRSGNYAIRKITVIDPFNLTYTRPVSRITDTTPEEAARYAAECTPTKLKFEKKDCGRCDGTGKYGYRMRCYGCSGTGRAFTPNGRRAFNWYTAQIENALCVDAHTLKTDNVIWSDADHMFGHRYDYKWRTVKTATTTVKDFTDVHGKTWTVTSTHVTFVQKDINGHNLVKLFTSGGDPAVTTTSTDRPRLATADRFRRQKAIKQEAARRFAGCWIEA